MIVHGLADGLFVVINGAEERQSLNVMKICLKSVPCKCKSQHYQQFWLTSEKIMWLRVAHTLKGTSCGLWSM